MIINDVEWPKWKTLIGIYPTRNETPGELDNGDDDKPDGEISDDDDFGDFPFPEDGDDFEGESGGDEASGRDTDSTEAPTLAPLPTFVAPLIVPDYRNREFASWSEFIDSVTDDSLYAWKTKRSSHRVDESGSFAGTRTWEDTIDLVRNGWPEGRQMLSDATVLVAPRPESYRSIELSVAGAYPLVPNYCVGDPECMVIDPGSDFRHSKPIVRIDYCVAIPSYVHAKDVMLRGAAVLSLADSLEARGISTELRVVHNGSNTRTYRTSVVFKRAGEYLDLDRAAFAMAHPSVQRRLMFAVVEQYAELEAEMASNYGRVLKEPNDPTSGKPGGAIFIPPTTSKETPESARKAVADAASAILNELHEAEELEGGHD